MISGAILTAVMLSLFIMGLWVSFNWQGMIFEPLAYHIEQWCYIYGMPYYLLKPLWACPTCMSSFWGTVYYAIFGHRYLTLSAMIIVIPATAFINTLLCILLNNTTDEGC